MFYKNKKAQGALEYLLIIGSAILVAVFVILIMNSTRDQSSKTVDESVKSYHNLIDQSIVPPIISSVTCDSSNASIKIFFKRSPSFGVERYCLYIDDLFMESTCKEPDSNSFISFAQLLIMGNEYNISLVAKKGVNYSSPSRPSISCVAE
jgi:hypothetical protein